MKRKGLKNRFYHDYSACFRKEIFPPRIEFKMKFLEVWLKEMGLFLSMGEWNAKVGTRFPQNRNIENTTDMGFELRTNMFIENDMSLLKFILCPEASLNLYRTDRSSWRPSSNP